MSAVPCALDVRKRVEASSNAEGARGIAWEDERVRRRERDEIRFAYEG